MRDSSPSARSAPPPPALAALVGGTTLLQHMRDAVVIADDTGRIVLWNDAATKIFGYSPGEATGKNVSMLVPDAMKARHTAGMARFHEHGTGPIIESGAILELPARHKDGSEIFVELTLSRLDDEKGRPLALALLRDVTERVRLTRASEADRRHLREANEALSSFSYVVGHDLKEPVRAVDAYLDGLRDAVHTDEARELLQKASEANTRLAGLLTGLIEWSLATLGGLEKGPLILPALLDSGSCRGRYQRAIEERGAKLTIRGEFAPILATEGLLCQVFGNLILNAIKHNASDPPEIEVIGAGVESGMQTVYVRDNGPGFPPEVRARMASLRTTRPSTVRGGFGLTIALRAVHALDGSIELANGPEGGAQVCVRLPIAGSPPRAR